MSESLTEQPRHPTCTWTVIVCVTAWALMRYAFFTGIAGSDDMHYMRFAAMWDRMPANHWEARLLGNGMTWLAMKTFGRGELAAALPSLLASATILACALYASNRYVGARAMLWSGLLAAVLPIDVYLSTTVSPFIIMTAFLSVGTLAFLHDPQTRLSRALAAVCFALGVVTHLSGVYYVAALATAGLWLAHRRYVRVIITMVAVGLLVIAIDMSVYHFAFDDALGRFNVCLANAGDRNPIMPTLPDGGINPEFITSPIYALLFSKAFGISMIATLLAGGFAYRRLPHVVRLVWIASLILWVWTSFGSQVPWSYKPFWRMSRYLHPLILALTVLFGATLGGRSALRARVPALAVLAVCLFNLLGGGSWGQSARISRELLNYAQAHPEKNFLTDYRTLNEMHVLNRVQSLPNVATTGEAARHRLLDPNAQFAWPVDLPRYDELLLNSLNLKKAKAFAALAESLGGELRFETSPAYRPICRLVRPLRRFDWAVRKPPARVVVMIPRIKSDTIAATDALRYEPAPP